MLQGHMSTFGFSGEMVVRGTGSALPSVCLSNDDLKGKGLDTSDEWIKSRTGIAQRYICGKGETTSTLAIAAGRQALRRAGVSPDKLSGIVVATCTPDLTFPSVAAQVHGALQAPGSCLALDVNAACSGFIYALAVARGLLTARGYVLVIGAEAFSKVVDWSDRGTAVLFGDGAGAVVLEGRVAGKEGKQKGLLGIDLGADGSQMEALRSTGGVATTQTAGVVRMQGKEVFKQAVRQMGAMPPLLGELGLELREVDWLIPHQANVRILQAAAESVGVPWEKVVVTVDQHANTSGASLPLALDVAVQDGRIKPGDLLMLQAFGAGMTWGTALVRW